jgi:CRP/FNR family transcriptional regulator, cyclic AMP receptor protein
MSSAKKLEQPLESFDSSAQGSTALDRLHEVGLFVDIRDDKQALAAIAATMSSRRYRPGEDIVTEGTTGTDMFILVEGRASVFKSTPQGDEYKVAIFEGAKNIAFGESGLIETDSRTATIRADTDCTCLVLERMAFEKFSATSPQWALPVYRRIAHAVMARLKKTNNDMMLLYNALVAEIRGQ